MHVKLAVNLISNDLVSVTDKRRWQQQFVIFIVN